ncbi:hypothetical protein QFZ75_003659 [Streptomyces sp. V3I8]|nr:hypothetical protein [Streptomyces sp. V3I8]MDQ1037243.1 hypothetical protein [Streptomyces sp. V3I8]
MTQPNPSAPPPAQITPVADDANATAVQLIERANADYTDAEARRQRGGGH